MVHAPIDLEFETVDLRLAADLPDEERVERERVLAPDIFGERAKQNLVGNVVLERELVEGAERDAPPVAAPFDDLILSAELEPPGFEAFTDILPKSPLDDQLPPIGQPVLELTSCDSLRRSSSPGPE